MLALNLARIRTAHERFDQVYQPDQLGHDEDAFTVVAPVTLGFDIYKDKDQFRLVGRVQTTLELPCSRCLEPFIVAGRRALRPALPAACRATPARASARSRRTT